MPMNDAGEKDEKRSAEDESVPTASAESAMVGLGEQIGRYKLLRVLGEGGFGIVYLAEQQRPIKRQVALKIIKPGMDSAQVIRRFEAERQALALLDHPNVAHVYDAGTTKFGRPYFVMEYVKGVPITEHCDRQKLTIEERLKLFVQVCEAIQHAHQKGIIHRDIKPSNIQVCIQGEQAIPKVIDFGVAKALSQPLTERTLVTEQGQLIGTPEYISPEQAEMTNQDIDTRSDIYSLGVVLYELLTGILPFESQTLRRGSLEQMRQILRETEPKTPSTRVSSLDAQTCTKVARSCQTDVATLGRKLRGDLDWITLKAMEKDRMRRYQTAHALAEDIERHLKHEPVLAGPPGTLYRFQKLVRRNQGVFAAVAVVAVVLVLGVLASTWQAAVAKRAERREARLRQEAQANELAMRRLAYASDMSLAQQALTQNNLGRAQSLLDRHRPKPGQSDLRGWEWRYLWQQCRSDELLTLDQGSDVTVSVTVSPDGNWLAVGGYRGDLSIWDLTTRRRVERLEAGQGAVRAAFSPGEPLLAFGSTTILGSVNEPSTVQLWDGETRQIVRKLPLSGRCVGIAFSDDGRTLVTASTGDPNGQITLWNVPDGRKLAPSYLVPPLSGGLPGWPFAVSRDLSMAACLCGSTLYLLDLATGQARWTKEASTGYFVTCAFSPDGKTLATSCAYAETMIRLWDTVSGKELRPLEGHRSCVYDLQFWRDDNSKLVSAGADQTIRVWDLTSGRSVATFRGHRDEVWRLALLPDHTTLVSGSKDGSVRLWDAAASRREHTCTRLPTPLRTWCFDTDGRSILTVDTQGEVARWHGADFQQRQPLFDVDPGLARFGFRTEQFSPDRRLLAAASPSGLVQVWDLQRREPIKRIPAQKGAVFPIAVLSQATKLVVVHQDDGSVHEWDLAAEREIEGWPGLAGPSAVVFSPDERLCFMFSYEGGSRVRDMTTGRQWHPNLDLGNQKTTESLVFSPDGRLFAAASFNSFARLWDSATFQEVATLGRFVLGAHSVAFTPDGTRLAVTSTGMETIRLWDMESYQDVLTLESQESRFVFGAFSPDGSILGALSMEGFLHLWRAPSWAQIEAAEKKQGRQSP
jgi:WD40 repeat protein/predicted Ser/Thr protein kinase